MTALARRRVQLVLAIVLAVASAWLIAMTDDVLEARFLLLGGCWETSIVNNTTVPTAALWAEHVATLDLNRVARFFYTRGGYTILLYVMGLCALVGWAGSVCLRIVRPPKTRADVTAEGYTASLVLALLAAGILYLMMVGSRLTYEQAPCLSRGYTYSVMMASLAAGLFTVAFYDWLEKRAPRLFNPTDRGDT